VTKVIAIPNCVWCSGVFARSPIFFRFAKAASILHDEMKRLKSLAAYLKLLCLIQLYLLSIAHFPVTSFAALSSSEANFSEYICFKTCLLLSSTAPGSQGIFQFAHLMLSVIYDTSSFVSWSCNWSAFSTPDFIFSIFCLLMSLYLW
jgi:hypothetical protein